MKNLRILSLFVLSALGAGITTPVALLMLSAGSVTAQDARYQLTGRTANFIATEKDSANAHNAKVSMLFEHALDSYKQNALVNRSIGKAMPDKPAVPMIHAIDEKLAAECFAEWWNAPYTPGLLIRQDYVIKKPLPVAPDAFDLEPKPIAQPADPVLGPDGSIPGQYLVATGDRHAVGTVITHPKYGRLLKFGMPTPFGTLVRWIALQ